MIFESTSAPGPIGVPLRQLKSRGLKPHESRQFGVAASPLRRDSKEPPGPKATFSFVFSFVSLLGFFFVSSPPSVSSTLCLLLLPSSLRSHSPKLSIPLSKQFPPVTDSVFPLPKLKLWKEASGCGCAWLPVPVCCRQAPVTTGRPAELCSFIKGYIKVASRRQGRGRAGFQSCVSHLLLSSISPRTWWLNVTINMDYLTVSVAQEFGSAQLSGSSSKCVVWFQSRCSRGCRCVKTWLELEDSHPWGSFTQRAFSRRP